MARLLLIATCLAAAILTVQGSSILEPEACGEHEIWNSCGTACPEHCPTRNEKTGEIESGASRMCIMVCRVGCQCATGFVRDAKRNNVCVERALCTAP